MPQLKFPCAATKTQCTQIKKINFLFFFLNVDQGDLTEEVTVEPRPGGGKAVGLCSF